MTSKKIGSGVSHSYQQFSFGIWGSFNTQAGNVEFLETKARLSNSGGATPESRLTQYLRPVREVLPVAEMSFNQLLQRDLDDHRVAVELVPYLLNPTNAGPAFFPPIVACLLPFSNQVPEENFPPAHQVDASDDEYGTWKPILYGNAFKTDRFMEGKTSEHPIKLGRVSWNPEFTELVIIDGQHRAMALLAIDRTINNRWIGKAEKYRSFYEPIVKECLSLLNEEQRKLVFSAVELPVTILWFPNIPASSSQHKAARKVFVDLNKNARPPSQSRLLLLSDTDLISVFTRSLMNELRSNQQGFPIYGIEYDNPTRDQASAAKWSTLTNVVSISECIRRVVCSPMKYFTDMSSVFTGRDAKAEVRMVFQKSLDISSVLTATIVDDRVYSRDEIDNEVFPPSKARMIESQFVSGWGYLIQSFFSDLTPFKAHAKALRELEAAWIPNGISSSSLAKEAVFEGVGLYWTLRESANHWRSKNAELKLEKKPLLTKTDVVEAWEITENKKLSFAELRCKAYLGSGQKTTNSDAAFGTFSTAACQIGFVLAARAISHKNNIQFLDIKKYSDVLISAANTALIGREEFMASSKVSKKSINMLPKLDTSYAIYFRYFWLQLFSSNESLNVLNLAGYNADFSDFLSVARTQYRDALIKESSRALRRANPSLKLADADNSAQSETDKSFKKALKASFGISAEAYATWISQIAQTASPTQSSIEEVETADVDYSNDQASHDPNIDNDVDELDQILKGIDES